MIVLRPSGYPDTAASVVLFPACQEAIGWGSIATLSIMTLSIAVLASVAPLVRSDPPQITG
ncbi:hypothetical protein QA943_40535 [Streptomyces sp. B21-097]|uniref:hypothetical protein n=1 Tax=Streptomyces TaxID=1883 RepID=UPI002FF23A27